MFTEKRLLIVGAILLAGATVLIEVSTSPDLASTVRPLSNTSKASALPPTAVATGQTEAPHTSAPAPLQQAAPMDTHVDGALRQDNAGRLVINLALRDYLDYFLGRIDIVGKKAALATLMRDARTRVEAPALAEFTTILDSYMNYKLALIASLDQPLSAPQQIDPVAQLSLMRQINEQVMQLRRQYLGEVVTTAFFSDEESYAQYTLQRMELVNDHGISDATREQALQALDQMLPPAILASRKQHEQEQVLTQETTQLLGSTESDEQLRAKLAQHYEPEAVERLLAEHRTEQDWQQRYQTYRTEVGNLDKATLAEPDRQRELNNLRERLFTANEQLRVQIQDSSAAPATRNN